MTRAEILNCLTDRPCDSCKFHESGRCERWDCVFEEEPDECEDAISRQAVDDAIYDYSRSCDVNYEQIMEYVNKIPSVTPKQRTGHWIKVDDEEPIAYDCSECVAMVGRRCRFCPDCGAKMVNPQESEEVR